MEVEASMPSVEYQIYPNYGVELLARDESFVQKRLWHSAFQGSMDALVEDLLHSENEIVHFQFNFGFFEIRQLGNAIERLAEHKKVVITFHKTEDSDVGGKIVSLKTIARQLNLCAALVVHQEKDKSLLEGFGIKESLIHLIPHGQIDYPEIASSYRKKEKKISSSLVIGSYGFLLPHKGVKETIGAVAELKKTYPDVLYLPVCALHDSQESKTYCKECMDETERLGVKENVRFITEFLPNDESIKYLQCCDVMVMPYKPSMESASGAVRFCLAAYRPIVTTKQRIFEEFQNCTYQIEQTDSQQIADAVKALQDANLRQTYINEEKAQIGKTCWHATMEKYYELYQNLC
jgi:glycosyltransferase involved in cell wall biosynthesis